MLCSGVGLLRRRVSLAREGKYYSTSSARVLSTVQSLSTAPITWLLRYENAVDLLRYLPRYHVRPKPGLISPAVGLPTRDSRLRIFYCLAAVHNWKEHCVAWSDIIPHTRPFQARLLEVLDVWCLFSTDLV